MSDDNNPAVDLVQSWTTNAKTWTAAVRSGAIESRLVTDRTVVEAVLARRPQRVLDLGCGEGWLVRALAEHGIESVGVDGSPALIEAAQSAGNGTFHICSYADLVAAPQQIGNGFDVIAANFALLDADIAPLLRALRLVLALGGAIVIQILHPWTVDGEYRDGWRKEDFRSFDGIWQPMPWYFRTLEAWIREVCKCGYAVIDLREPKHPDTQAPLSLIIVAESKEG